MGQMNQKEMNTIGGSKTSLILGVLVIILIIAGIVYASTAKNVEKKAMMESETMMQKDIIEKQDSMTGEESMVKDESPMMQKENSMASDTMMSAGSYEVYASEKLARAEKGDVVLFFRASWCPTCKTVDTDIKGHLAAIPSNLTILDVDYDTMTELKKKYGVTYQHTFVQVDASGKMLAKWSGSLTLTDLVLHVK